MLSDLNETPRGCALHLVTKPFSEAVEIKRKSRRYCLENLFKDEYLDKDLNFLKRIGKSVWILNLTPILNLIILFQVLKLTCSWI